MYQFIITMFLLYNIGLYITVIMFGYHWGMGREFNYSTTITAFGFAGYIGYRVIPFIIFGLMNSVKFKVVCKRISEVLNMDEFNKSGFQSDLDQQF
jgi:hypothetical protein